MRKPAEALPTIRIRLAEDLPPARIQRILPGFLLVRSVHVLSKFFDQLYQYEKAGKNRITELGKECLEEDETPDHPELEDL